MYAGIDVGGTNLKAGVCDANGRLLAVRKAPVPAFTGAEDFARILAELVRDAAGEAGVPLRELEWTGIGIPGAAGDGKVIYTCNIPLTGAPLGELFRRYLDVPVYLGNDADCAAVGEYFCGAGRGTRDFIVITLGTGIGGGLIMNGKVYAGSGMAGEVGHMVIEKDGELCNCGRRGCWEAYASATGLVRMTREMIRQRPESGLAALAAEQGEVTAQTAFLAAARGDAAGEKLRQRYLSYLAAGVTNLVNIFQPQVLALGGGVSNERRELLLEPLQALVEKECYARHGGAMTRIVAAELGNDAGVIGAALLPKAK
jgi:glucokinase